MDAAAPTPRRHRTDRDLGTTFIEILVAIVLLGMTVVATLVALSSTLVATALDRDHANAHAWLQTGADMLYAREFAPCDRTLDPATNIATITADYEATLRQTTNPEGWPDANIEITDLSFWYITSNPVTNVADEGWGSVCDDNDDTNLQRVTIQVRADDGRIVEEVEVIVGA